MTKVDLLDNTVPGKELPDYEAILAEGWRCGDCFKVLDKDGDTVVMMRDGNDNFMTIATDDTSYDVGDVWEYEELMEHLQLYKCEVKEVGYLNVVVDE